MQRYVCRSIIVKGDREQVVSALRRHLGPNVDWLELKPMDGGRSHHVMLVDSDFYRDAAQNPDGWLSVSLPKWFGEDSGLQAPYPQGSLLYYGDPYVVPERR